MKNYMTKKEAAEYLGVGVSVLDQAKNTGMIAYVQYTENGRVYFTEEALKEFIERSTHPAKTPEQVRHLTHNTYRKVRSTNLQR